MAHGSKDPRWRRPFERMARMLRAERGKNRVFLCYLEFAKPGLREVLHEAVLCGMKRVTILPLFLAAGGHVVRDLAPSVTRARSEFRGLRIKMLPPVGEHARFVSLVREISAICF